MHDHTLAAEVAEHLEVERRDLTVVAEHTAASRPREPDETAIATQTPSAETWSEGSATVAAA